MKNKIKYTLAASTVALMSACGGGGDDSSIANADPQGFWSGPASTGYTVDAAVLDKGETWGIYSSGSIIFGALYGTATTSGNTVSIRGTEFNFLTNSSTTGNLTGPVVAKSSMSLSNNNVTIALKYQPTYDTAATPAAIAGKWSFIGRSSSSTLVPGTITINSAGAFTLSQTGCVTTGNVVPRPGGKNVYNVTLAAVGANCAAGQSKLSGVAYLDTTVTPNKLFSLALTPSKKDGLVVIGTKQ